MMLKDFLRGWRWSVALAIRLMVMTFALLSLCFLTDLIASAQDLKWEQTKLYGGDIRALLAMPDGTLYAGTWWGGGVFRSDDKGNTWVEAGLSRHNVNSLAAMGTTLYAGIWGGGIGGVFRSDDKGNTWVEAGLNRHNVSSLAVMGTTLYAGTDEGGIFRSDNRGNSWSEANVGLSKRNVQSLAVTGTTLYAGTLGGVFRSDDRGNTWVEAGLSKHSVRSLLVVGTTLYAGTWDGGVFRSDNRGSGWSEANVGLSKPIGQFVQPLAVMGATLYAGTLGGVFRSDDRGDTWVEAGLSKRSVQLLLVVGTTLYAGTWDGGVFRSNDKGDNWTEANMGLSSLSSNSFAIIGATFYAGTIGGVFRSDDKGNTWVEMLRINWIHSLVVMGTTLYAGMMNGIFRSDDKGNNWSKVNLRLTDNYWVQSLLVMGTTLYAGTFPKGVFRSDDGGNSWTEVNVGLSNRNVYSLAVMGATLYAGTNNGGVFRSDDKGSSWINVGLSNRIVQLVQSLAVIGTTFYAGTSEGVFRSDDRGNTWVEVGLRNWTYSFLVMNTTLYAGTNGGVFCSDDKGSSWINVGLSNRTVQSLAVMGATLYAGTSSGVFRTNLPPSVVEPTPGRSAVLPTPPKIEPSPIIANSSPVVSNVKAQQRPKTKIVDITYDVDDPDGNLLTITVEISDDGGNTFKVPAKTFKGDVGSGIKPGKGKKVEWDAGKDAPNVFGTNYRTKVIASDGVIGAKAIIGKDGAEMILIPAGEFLMGSPPGEGAPDEHPQHKVYLDAFYIDKYEVTNAQYKKFIDATGHPAPDYWNDNSFNKPEQPVVRVTWFDAEAYCKWAGKRLPTEAEWEKVARGTDGRKYPWGNEAPNAGGIWRANYDPGDDAADGFAYTAPVGSYPAGVSPYGIHDMAGNVWEWVADWYDGGYYAVSPKNNPKGPSSGTYRVLRGGSWGFNDFGDVMRAANRRWFPPHDRFSNFGFRCAQDITPLLNQPSEADIGFALSNIFTLDTRDITLAPTITATLPIIADGISTSIITISIKDSAGNPMPNKTIAISATGSDNIIIQPSSPTDQNGIATAKIKSTKAETKTVSIKVDGTSVATTAKVEFLPDVVSIANSTITSSGGVISDGTSQIKLTIILLDANKNPIKGKKATISSTGTGNIITQAATLTDEKGITTASISSTKAEDKTINATVAVDEIKLKPITVTFTLPPQPKLVVRATSPHIADGEDTSTIIMILTDPNDNPLPNKSLTVLAAGSGNILIQPASLTDASGRTIAKLKSTNPEIKTVTATYEFEGQKVQATASVEFSKPALPPPPTQLAVSGNLIKLDNVASVEITGKASPNAQVNLSLKDGVNTIQKSATSEASGLFKLIMDASSLKDGNITVVASEAGGQEASITVIKDTKPIITEKPEFLVGALNPIQSSEIGKSTVYIINLISKGGFKSDLTLRIADAPMGVVAEFNPKVVSISTENPSNSSQLTIRVGNDTPIGDHKFIVSAVALDKSIKEVELQLQVKTPALKNSFITIDVEPTQPRLGDKLKVKGEVIFQEGEVKVKLPLTISYTSPKGEAITQNLQTDEAGKYLGELEIKQQGKWEISANWAGDKIYKAAQKSKAIEVLKGMSQIAWQQALQMEKSIGDKISLIAQLKPDLEKQTIKVQIIKPNGISTVDNIITQQNGIFKVDLELNTEGIWKLVASWEGNESYEKTVSAETQIIAATEAPKVIIVLGGGSERDNPAWNKFAGLANHVYKILKNRKLSDDDIYYLSPTLKTTEAIDKPTSESALEFAITQWAKQRVGAHVPLFIYLLSHNLNDQFILEKRGDYEVTLTPEKLNGWLDVLPKGTEVTIIIEACYSGNFIRKKGEGRETPVLSKPGRVIITSADNNRQAIIEGVSLLSFTRIFFDEIARNRDVKTAFLNTRESLRASRSLQSPQLDANGDGVSNDPSRDFPALGSKYIPTDIQLLPSVPEIQDVSKPQQLKVGEKSATIKVRLTGVDILKVIGTVIPPNYVADREFKSWDDVDFEVIKFERKEEGLYEGRYDNFSQVGAYTIVIHAENPDGSAIPVETTVTVLSPPWDVNSDGEVNIFDIVIVAKNVGIVTKEGDVNDDGKVNIFDLVIVVNHFGEKSTSASPSLKGGRRKAEGGNVFPVELAELRNSDYSQYLPILEKAYQLLQASSNSSPEFERARKLLERLIALAKPVVKETKLLANYPNPFNPETWIPYQLANSADVSIRIYDVAGRLVQTLNLGGKETGFYLSRDRAAYWDGRNEMGERVASGVYFYQLQAGNFSDMRKMLMLK